MDSFLFGKSRQKYFQPLIYHPAINFSARVYFGVRRKNVCPVTNFVESESK